MEHKHPSLNSSIIVHVCLTAAIISAVGKTGLKRPGGETTGVFSLHVTRLWILYSNNNSNTMYVVTCIHVLDSFNTCRGFWERTKTSLVLNATSVCHVFPSQLVFLWLIPKAQTCIRIWYTALFMWLLPLCWAVYQLRLLTAAKSSGQFSDGAVNKNTRREIRCFAFDYFSSRSTSMAHFSLDGLTCRCTMEMRSLSHCPDSYLVFWYRDKHQQREVLSHSIPHFPHLDKGSPPSFIMVSVSHL